MSDKVVWDGDTGDEVTYEVLPQRNVIDAQILLCSLRGHKFTLDADNKSLLCFDCGAAWQQLSRAAHPVRPER